MPQLSAHSHPWSSPHRCCAPAREQAMHAHRVAQQSCVQHSGQTVMLPRLQAAAVCIRQRLEEKTSQCSTNPIGDPAGRLTDSSAAAATFRCRNCSVSKLCRVYCMPSLAAATTACWQQQLEVGRTCALSLGLVGRTVRPVALHTGTCTHTQSPQYSHHGGTAVPAVRQVQELESAGPSDDASSTCSYTVAATS